MRTSRSDRMSLGNKMKSKSETIFEGYLIKSPPRKKFEKIWKLVSVSIIFLSLERTYTTQER